MAQQQQEQQQDVSCLEERDGATAATKQEQRTPLLAPHYTPCPPAPPPMPSSYKYFLQQREKLLQEVWAMQDLNGCESPHLVKLLDLCEYFYDWHYRVFVVMPLAQGGDLISDPRKYSEDDARVIFGQVVSAVQSMHQRGWAHRDIKLDNVFIANAGGSLENNLWLGDFGLATTRTTVSELQGSPPICAPEYFVKGESDPKRADLWSLGVVLYNLVAKQWVFWQGPDNALVHMQMARQSDAGFRLLASGTHRFPPNFRISADAADLISSLLKIKPEDRISLEGVMQHRWMCGSRSIATPVVI